MTDNEPAGWRPDPTGRFEHRYWDGTSWTDHVANAGVASTDPYDGGSGATVPDATVPDAPAPIDPTAAQSPVGDAGPPTATYPVPPGPPVTPPPVPPAFGALGSPGGPVSAASSGSKRGLLIGGGILAVVILAVAAFLLFGGDDDGNEDRVRAELMAMVQEDSSISDEQAECVANVIIDEIGIDRLKDVDFSADEPPADIEDDFIDASLMSLARCDIDLADLEGTDGSDGPSDGSGGSGRESVDTDLEALRDDCADGDFVACDELYFNADFGSELEEFGSTCGGIAEPQYGFCEETEGGEVEGDFGGGFGDGDMTDMLTEIYQSMGLSEAQASCLAERILEDLGNLAQVDPDEVMSSAFGYLSDCDISPNDFRG